MKTCTKCGVPKEEGEFSKHSKGNLRSDCRTCRSLQDREYRSDNLEKVRQYDRNRYKENREARRESNRKWVRENLEESRSNARERANRKYHSNPEFKALVNLRNRIGHALSGKSKKSARTKELLGCPWVWLEVHLESFFKPGMTWANHGPVWHIDHIKPCALFNLSDPEQQRICFHWTNLQPLFKEENLRKSKNFVNGP